MKELNNRNSKNGNFTYVLLFFILVQFFDRGWGKLGFASETCCNWRDREDTSKRTVLKNTLLTFLLQLPPLIPCFSVF